MKKTRPPLSFAVVLLIALTAPFDLAVRGQKQYAEAREAQLTIAADKGWDLLQTYRSLYPLSISERRVLFNRASSKEKSDIWKLHLALALARRAALTTQQQQVLLAGISLATPELFQIPGTDPAWKRKVDEPLKALATRALEVFSKEEAAELFAHVPAQIPNTDDDLLQTYSVLNSLSLVERKIVFRQASPKGKSNLWKLHLALSLIKHPGFTEDQQRVILEAISFASAEVFEPRGKDFASKTKIEVPLHALSSRAVRIFSPDEGAEIFAQLGGSAGSSTEINAFLPRGLVKTAHALPIPDCDCSHSSDWCTWTVCSGNICNRSRGGCGFLWWYDCDGICYRYTKKPD